MLISAITCEQLMALSAFLLNAARFTAYKPPVPQRVRGQPAQRFTSDLLRGLLVAA